MIELIHRLETAVLHRNSMLAERLRPGLPVERIKKDLKRAGINGAIQPVVDLYSWKNGTVLDIDLASSKTGFTPESVFHFTELKRAIVDMNGFKEVSHYHPRLAVLVGRYFPFLWDGATGWIATDIKPSGNNAVVTIQFEDDEPLRQAYPTFELFLKDLIRANEENDSLFCFQVR